MNYRQWKKNYKKQHGENPPLSVDKRKQAKAIRKQLKQINLVCGLEPIAEVAIKMNNILRDAMAQVFKGLGYTFQSVGKCLEETADNFERSNNLWE